MKTTIVERLKTHNLAALLIAVALAGCASNGGSKTEAPSPAPAAAAKPTTAAAAPSASATAKSMTAPGGNQGTVVFFREKKFAGAAVSFKVRENGNELGKLSSGTYFSVNLPRGKHSFEVHSEAKDVLTLEVEPGQTYYVQGSVSFGVMVGHPNLAPSDAATFESMRAKLKDSAAIEAAKKKK